MAIKGKCVREGCDSVVDFGDIEVVGEGFACSIICSNIVEGTISVVDKYDW